MAASTTFIIFNTAGQPVSAIQPNTLDGPQGVQQNSDLRMYGLGFPNWGEGVDENDYHLIENFACPSLSTFPASARYALLGPTVAAVTPAGQAGDELGAGNGINVPLVGQLWYNTTGGKLYVNTVAYPNPAWAPVGSQAVSLGTMPLTPTLGQLWYDQTTVPAQPQLKIYNGSTFVSVAQYYLPLAGGTMTGAINMSNTQINALATPTLATDAATKGYVDAAVSGGVTAFVMKSGDTMTGNLNMSNASVGITNGQLDFASPAGGIAISAGNGRITNLATPAVGTDAVNANWVSANFLNLLGGGLGGLLNMNNHALQGVPLPSVGTDAANKTYVDSAVSGGQGTGVLAASGYWKFGSGLVIQWGTLNTTANAGSVAVAFPTAFPNACFSVVTDTIAAGGPGGAGSWEQFLLGGPTTSGFTVRTVSSGNPAVSIPWVAVGF